MHIALTSLAPHSDVFQHKKRLIRMFFGLLALIFLFSLMYASFGQRILAQAAGAQHELLIRTIQPTGGTVPNNDNIGYEVRGNTNFADATNVNVTLTAENAVFDQMPGMCKTTGVTPVSSISTDGHTLICNIGNWRQGSSFFIAVTARALGPNNAEANLSGSVSSDNGGTANAEADPRTITATFEADLGVYNYESNVPHAFAPHPVTDAPGTAIPYFWRAAVNVGSEAPTSSINATLAFTDADNPDYSQIIPYPGTTCTTVGGQPDWNDDGDRSNDTVFAILNEAAAFSRLGDFSENASLAGFGEEFFNSDSGNCALTGSNGTFTLTVTDIDNSLTHVPTKARSYQSTNVDLPSTEIQYASGVIWFWAPAAWTDGGTNPITGSLELSITSYNPVSVSGQANAVGADNTANNTTTDTITRPGSWSQRWAQTAPWGGVERRTAGSTIPTVQSMAFDPNETDEVMMCQPIGANLSIANDDEPGLPYDTAVIAYAKDVTGRTTPYVDVPAVGIVEYSTSAMPNPNSATCGSSDGPWSTTMPSDRTTITRVRYRITPSAINNPEYYAIYLSMWQKVSPTAPVGTELWSYGVRSIDGGATWLRPADLDTNPAHNVTTLTGKQYPGTNSYHDYAEVVGAIAKPSKSTANGRTVLNVGDRVPYKIDTVVDAGSTAITLRLTDTIPTGMSFNNDANVAPVSVTENGDGSTTIVWEIPGVATGTHNLTYSTTVNAPTTTSGATNTVQARALNSVTGQPVDDAVPEEQRSSSETINTTADGYTTIEKSVDTDVIQQNGSFNWNIALKNFDPTDQEYTDIIDVFPYNSDNRTPATDYDGSYEIGDITANDGQTIYYTTTNPDSINLDPGDASNGAAGDPTGNTVGWTTTRPASGITAIRVVGGVWAAGAADRTVTIAVTTKDNSGGNIYTNRVGARTEHTFLRMFSPDVTTRVVENLADTGSSVKTISLVAVATVLLGLSLTMMRHRLKGNNWKLAE